jgi:(p)ppGpp synthase/HD superfamily hydrolase
MNCLILKAIRFAEQKHQGQKRKFSGEDYISHPIIVSYYIPYFKNSKNINNLICAGILHDTVEDTQTSYNEILEQFGMSIASLVFELTSSKEEIDKIGKTEYLKKKMVGCSSYALVIKLIDRLANISDNPTEKMLQDTRDIISFVKENRKLTKTHLKIIARIEEVLNGNVEELEEEPDSCIDNCL